MKIALAVGINHFQQYPHLALQGCVNDAHTMAQLWMDFYGVKAGNIKTLVDGKATKAAIVRELERMVKEAKKGNAESLFFSLSSHGTQVPDCDGDEPDRADEAFCPTDLCERGDCWDPDHLITDDELQRILLDVPEGALFEIYLDTCHSGTGIRSLDLLPSRLVKFIPGPTVAAYCALVDRHARTFRELVRGKQHIVAWSACRSDQTSQDALIGNGWHGAFTYYFDEELRRTKNKIPRKELLARVRAELKKHHYPQVPQLECTA
jgi:metacaspase-1